MNRLPLILSLLAIQTGCSIAYLTGKAPFPRSSIVARLKMGELETKVAEQHEFFSHPRRPNIFGFKEYPSPEELKTIRAHFRDGDEIIEFKNGDWTVGIDHMSINAEFAFCIIRGDRAAFTLKVWPTSEDR